MHLAVREYPLLAESMSTKCVIGLVCVHVCVYVCVCVGMRACVRVCGCVCVYAPCTVQDGGDQGEFLLDDDAAPDLADDDSAVWSVARSAHHEFLDRDFYNALRVSFSFGLRYAHGREECPMGGSVCRRDWVPF